MWCGLWLCCGCVVIMLSKWLVAGVCDGFGDEMDDCFGDGLMVLLLLCGVVYHLFGGWCG